MVSWSASTGGCSARCWASPSRAIGIWRRCSRASTRPTTGDASACSRGDPRSRSCNAAWRPSRSWPTGATSRPIQTRCRQPSGSSLAPRRSRIQTPSTTVAPFVCDVRLAPWPDALVATRTRRSRRQARSGAAGDVWRPGGFPGQTSIPALQSGFVVSFLG